jgi:hypothetical protein
MTTMITSFTLSHHENNFKIMMMMKLFTLLCHKKIKMMMTMSFTLFHHENNFKIMMMKKLFTLSHDEKKLR